MVRGCEVGSSYKHHYNVPDRMANQGTYVTMNGLIIRGNQLPVSATGWQHVSQICFASLYSEKSELKKSTTIKTTEKISVGILRTSRIFDECLTKFKNNQILLNIIN